MFRCSRDCLAFWINAFRLDRTPWVSATVHHRFDLLPRLWPSAKFVFLHRDPRDVARSSVRMGWAGNAWGGVRTWTSAQNDLNALKNTVDATQILEVRFEELVTDPVAVLERICGFLELPFDDAMLEIEKDTTYRRPNPGEAASWRSLSATREIREMEMAIGHERLLSSGYQPSGLVRMQPTLLNELRLRVEDQWGRRVFGIRRYGIALYLLIILQRFVPSNRFRSFVAGRKDRVDVRLLK